jgi:hypothetical protein
MCGHLLDFTMSLASILRTVAPLLLLALLGTPPRCPHDRLVPQADVCYNFTRNDPEAEKRVDALDVLAKAFAKVRRRWIGDVLAVRMGLVDFELRLDSRRPQLSVRIRPDRFADESP